ncbi:hypothetical protein HDK90DRAFT_467254 [Phyllosticta capitalensis]|uniref:Uncharacterized protein n=1 Tax=Phyllosticta capitalensis TaxID=121624 RepID=A0ABR1YJZ4_9PEZI
MGKGRANEKSKGRAIKPAQQQVRHELTVSRARSRRSYYSSWSDSSARLYLDAKEYALPETTGRTDICCGVIWNFLDSVGQSIRRLREHAGHLPLSHLVDEAARASDPEILSVFAWYKRPVSPFDLNDGTSPLAGLSCFLLTSADVVKQYFVHEAVLLYDDSGHTRTTYTFKTYRLAYYAEALGVLCEEVLKDLVMKGFANHAEPTPQEQVPRPFDITQYWTTDCKVWLPSARQGYSTAFEFSVDILGCLALLAQMGSLGSINRLSEMTILMEKEVQRQWENEAAVKEADVLGTIQACY